MKHKGSIIIAIYVASLLLLGTLSLVALQSFANIEQEEVIEDVLQAQSLLRSEVQQLAITADDYAGWDDTYAFAENQNKSYLIHSLGNTFFSKLRLSLFCIIKLDGTVIYMRSSSTHNKRGHILPEILGPQSEPFQAALSNKTTSGIISLSGELMMIAASPVLTTELQGPVRGMLVIGRLLSKAEVQRIGNLANFTLAIHQAGSPEAMGIIDKKTLQSPDIPQVKVLEKERVAGYGQLKDINNQPVGALSLEKTRHTYLNARKIILLLSLFCGGVFSLLAIAFYRLSQRLAVVNIQEYTASQQLKTFFELAVDGIFRLDQQYLIIDVNKQAAALTGYQHEELLGKPFDTLFSKEEVELHPLDTQRLRAGMGISLQRNLSRKEGTFVPIELRLKLLPDGDCQCVMQDRTEQAYWEGRLHQQQELLNGIINGTDDIIYAKDLDGYYLLINKSGLQFARKKSVEVLGLRDCDIFPSAVARIISDADQRTLQAGTVLASEDTIPYPDGTETTFLATRAPLINKQGQLTGLCAILHDVTIRSMLEKELLSQHNRLGQLAVSVSLAEERERIRIAEDLHDQVGPTLLSGKMKLNMLQSRLHDQGLIAECEAIDSLISQSVKEIRSLTLQLRPPILANAGLEAALKWLAQEFNQKYSLQISFSDDGQPKPLQYEKRTILFQTVRELLLNVVKHAQCNTADISVSRTAVGIQIVVTDNGKGFKTETALASTHTSGGFGLFNCTQKLSHIHGRLAIDSTYAAGARITLEAQLDL